MGRVQAAWACSSTLRNQLALQHVLAGAAIGAGTIKYWRGFTELLESNLSLIGKKGVTPDTLDAKMSKEYLAMLKNAN